MLIKDRVINALRRSKRARPETTHYRKHHAGADTDHSCGFMLGRKYPAFRHSDGQSFNPPFITDSVVRNQISEGARVMLEDVIMV